MINNKKYILFLCFAFSAVVQVFSIKCWECSSYTDPQCAPPFEHSEIPISDCAMQRLPHLPKLEAIACRTIKQQVKDELRYTRSCAFLVEDAKEGPDGKTCIKNVGPNGISVEHCTCKFDGCNV